MNNKSAEIGIVPGQRLENIRNWVTYFIPATYQIDPGRGQHTTALCAGWPVAGLAGVAVQAGHMGWTVYLTSASITHTAASLPSGAGQVLHGPVDVTGHGRVLIGAHPTGGVIGFWQPATPWIFRTTRPGALLWAELNTWHGALTDKIFANLFGYRQAQIGGGVDLDYTTWSRVGSCCWAGFRLNEDWADPETRAHWMLHLAVDPQTGTDAAVDRVLELGGRVDIDPYDSPWGRMARVADPFGARFALIDPTTRIMAADLAPGSARVDDPYDD